MASTLLEQPASEQQAPVHSRTKARRRPPVFRDYLRYFIGIPVMLAVVFSLVGTRLTHGMAYLDAFTYMLLHMFVAWWSVNCGATVIKFSFRSWRPPTIVICLVGLLISLIPAAFLFQALGDYFATLYPVFAENRYDSINPSWTMDYLMHFIRYSAPVLPTFLAGVYGYRAASGVDWFAYDLHETRAVENNADESSRPKQAATAELIEGTSLPADASLIAIKAEQHYIRIWSDKGTDFIRYRFRDLIDSLGQCEGTQVHRSWWVNLNYVDAKHQAGRKLELKIGDKLIVPVSLSYKNAVLEKLGAGN